MHLLRSMLCLVGLLLCAVAGAQTGVATDVAPRVVNIYGSEDALLLSPHSLIFEDTRGTLDLDQVRKTLEGWKRGRADALVFGFSESSWWVHVRIHNAAAERVISTIDLGNPRQDYVTWHVLRKEGPVETIEAGDRLPFSARVSPRRNLVLQLITAPDESVDLFIKLRSEDGLFEAMPLRLSRTNVFIKTTSREEILFTLCAGGLLALGLYNLLLYFSTRERVFGIYVLYLALLTTWTFTFAGFAFQHIWPNQVDLNHMVLTLTSALGIAAFGWFALEYLHMRERVPQWLYRMHLALIAYSVLVCIPGVFGSFAVGAALAYAGGLAMSAVTIPTAIYLVLRGSREAKFFVIAFGLLWTGICMYILQIVAIVPTNWFTTWSLQIGLSLESLLLALGLADSLNVLKAEKFDAERRALEAQQALNLKLEHEVSERTKELELANRRLQELTITDELTGAFNRRHFNAICAASIANRKRDGALAFCMFDIDHFKAYNDRYGHQAGDAALRAVARAVQTELHRAGDVLFRLGGEEFGVAFDAATQHAAIQFAERMRNSIRRLQIAHLGSPQGIITASFGVGWWSSVVVHRLTADQIYAVADRALYDAKTAGRDRTETASSSPTGMFPKLNPDSPTTHAESA